MAYGDDPQSILDNDYYRSARRRVNDTYGMGVSQNTQQQSQLRNTFGRQKGDLVRQFADMRERLPGSFAGRGMLNSGMYQHALTQFGDRRAQSFADLGQQQTDGLAGLQLARDQMEWTRGATLGDLEEQQAARRRAIAASLQAAQGMGI